MHEWDFTLIVDGDLTDDVVVEKLIAHGADDATFGVAASVAYADFSREAASFPSAVMSAIHDVEGVPGISVLRVEPDDLVTQAEIAERLDRSREGVRLLAAGHRGKGTFPSPVSHLRARSKLWRWSDVARWAGALSPEEERDARFVAMVNAALDLRRLRRQARDPDEEGVEIFSSIVALTHDLSPSWTRVSAAQVELSSLGEIARRLLQEKEASGHR
jgi:hypothetical protein